MGIREELTKKGEQDLPKLEVYEIIDRIKMLQSDRDKALVAFLFLTACRISEVVHLYKEPKYWKDPETGYWWVIGKRRFSSEGIKKKQIDIDYSKDLMMINNVRTLKKKRHQSKTKNIPIIISKEKALVDIFIKHLNTIDLDTTIFPITRQRAYQILIKADLFNHYMRHLRLTNLVVKYGFSAHQLKHFVNWVSIAPSDIYVHLNVEELIKQMR